MGARSSLIVPVGALAAALAIGACGSSDFKNDPRPPSPIAVGARIADREVDVSPRTFGAGPVTLTISNQSPDPARLVLEGPTDAQSEEIVPNGTTSLQTNLHQGDYTLSNDENPAGRDTTLKVGPQRASSQNQLLEP